MLSQEMRKYFESIHFRSEEYDKLMEDLEAQERGIKQNAALFGATTRRRDTLLRSIEREIGSGASSNLINAYVDYHLDIRRENERRRREET